MFITTAASKPNTNAAAVLKNPNTRDTAPANLTSPPPIPFLVTAEDIKSIKMIPAKAIKDKINSFGSLPIIPVIPSVTDKKSAHSRVLISSYAAYSMIIHITPPRAAFADAPKKQSSAAIVNTAVTVKTTAVFFLFPPKLSAALLPVIYPAKPVISKSNIAVITNPAVLYSVPVNFSITGSIFSLKYIPSFRRSFYAPPMDSVFYAVYAVYANILFTFSVTFGITVPLSNA